MSRKHSFLIAKILIGVACFGFIGYRLKNQFTTENLLQLKFTFSDPNNIQLLTIAFLLLSLNWGIESFKWKLITAEIERISFGKSIRSVLAGLCIGNLTPGRIGEFAGRVLFFSPENRSRISITHFVCGLTQLFTTVVFGIFALGFLLNTGVNQKNDMAILLGACSCFLFLLLVLVVRINKIYTWLARLKFMQRFDLGNVNYQRSTIVQLLLLSCIRYFVFSYQYFLLLKICGIKAESFQVFCAIAVSFMLMSSIPMISFIEVAIRAAIAVMLFGQFQENSLQLVTASTLLWLINIVIPSVIGYVFLFREKIQFKTVRTAVK
jgi:hypothetical protein